MLPELSLEGKSAVVTGAGRGIGRAIALVLAEAGADVAVAARTVSEIEATAAQIEALGRRSIAVPADVSDSDDAHAMIDAASGAFGKIDILVNNAGKLSRGPVVPLPDADELHPGLRGDPTVAATDEEWQTTLDTNLSGVYYCSRAVGAHMIERRYGKIVNITSNNGVQAFPLVAAYNASKAGVNMLTRVLALEWAPYNICVNAIGPGDYHTAMTDATWSTSEGRRNHLDAIPMHREGDLRELGILAAYLASPASDYITGQIIYLDGGLTAK
ncbi:MAG: SDR family oxidoreductase [SAR202 cluster bacterium]|nr:hypothetical protein [Chloroflexota bacterium]MQG70386.1 SDR family oxidoreductase [SAR202 cluster bacterium]